jgi:hypothetical protein
MNLFQKLLRHLRRFNYPPNLRINGRRKLANTAFQDDNKLYHAFDENDIDEGGIRLETIRFPDFSCNWCKFSTPQDVRYRMNGKTTDGCYSFAVVASRYKNIATPVHDPLEDKKHPNYAHTEVRELLEGEDILFEPPKNRKGKSKKSKSNRLEYRQNLLNNITIELDSL